MIIHLKDTAIQLNPSEVRAAKKLISRFITSVSSASKRTGQISFYFTVLIIMHMMSQQLLETFDPKDLQEIMKKYLLPLLLCFCCLFPCLALAAEADTAVPGADMVATIIGWLPESWGQWITFVVTLCAAISAVWPRPADDANVVVRFLYTVVNALGFNAGKAQNADDAAARNRL